MSDEERLLHTLDLCFTAGTWGELLAYLLYVPLFVLLGVSFLHFVMWDVLSLMVYWLDFFVVWLPIATASHIIQQPRPNARDDGGACAGTSTYLGTTAMPDPWQTTLVVYVALWTTLAVMYRQKRLALPLTSLWVLAVLFEASMVYNRYTTWTQLVVSLALVPPITAMLAWLIDSFLLDEAQVLSSTTVGRWFGLMSNVHRMRNPNAAVASLPK